MKLNTRFLFLIAVVSLAFASCSSTRNAIGVDTVNGFIRTGKWTKLTKEVYETAGSNTSVNTEVLADGKYLEFKSDNKAHIYSADGAELSSVPYSFTDTKTMVYDGVTYKIQENMVSTITDMTLVSEANGGKTVLKFRR